MIVKVSLVVIFFLLLFGIMYIIDPVPTGLLFGFMVGSMVFFGGVKILELWGNLPAIAILPMLLLMVGGATVGLHVGFRMKYGRWIFG